MAFEGWASLNVSSKMRVGDLGIVRNHVYSITVNSISGLGTGVRSLDQPIVPPFKKSFRSGGG